MLLVILIYKYIAQCSINLLVNNDLSSCILLVFNEYSSDVKTPTAFSPNVANYASRRTALFIAMSGSCDVMPCYPQRRP